MRRSLIGLNAAITLDTVLPIVTPTALLRIPEPFDHSDFVYEMKYDGFRALAYIDGHHCRLVSRRGHVYKSWPYLATELAHAVRCHSAVLDTSAANGSSNSTHLPQSRTFPAA